MLTTMNSNPGVSISPPTLATVSPVVGTGGDAAGTPLADSQQGSIFLDGGGGNLRWYLPAYQIVADPDINFHFLAQQSGVNAQGDPYNTASINIGLQQVVPDDVTAAQKANPALQFKEIPLSGMTITLQMSYHAGDGSLQQASIPATIGATDTRMLFIVDGLLGSDVIMAFNELTATGSATIKLIYSYVVVSVRELLNEPPVSVPINNPPVLRNPPIEVGNPRPPIRLQPVAPNIVTPRNSDDAVYILRQLTQTSVSIPIGIKYAGPSYRQQFTVTAEGHSEVIVDAAQLKQFDVHESEYSELTVLGDIATKYPSFRALYLGAVSGTVVAIPAAYGIVRGTKGCAAECDAIIDTGSDSGCQFNMSFTVAPIVDPTDFGRLALDLAAAPSLQGRQLHLTMPSDLDSRTPPTFSPAIGNASIGVGLKPQTFLLTTSIKDDGSTPAIVKANLFLHQLGTNDTSPLFARVAVRLDDAYPSPVFTQIILNLHNTSGSDDLAVDISNPPNASVRNCAPFGLATSNYATQNNTGLTVTPWQTTLAVGSTTPITISAGTTQLLIDRTLLLPDAITSAVLSQYLAVRAEDVQQVHHVLGINATGIDFPGLGITNINVSASLTNVTGIQIPALSLNPAHKVDNTTVNIPVNFAITGMPTTLTITVTSSNPGKVASQVSINHDFVDEPIFVLTAAALH